MIVSSARDDGAHCSLSKHDLELLHGCGCVSLRTACIKSALTLTTTLPCLRCARNAQLAEHKHIKDVEFVTAIPKSPSGKILRRVLRELEREKKVGVGEE